VSFKLSIVYEKLAMKRFFPVCLVITITFLSCKKETSVTAALQGSWRLIKVYNDSLSITIPRPADATGDFTLSFQNDKQFSGQTFRNTFSNGAYKLTNITDLRITAFATSKVGEDAWGQKFDELFQSCASQSVSPCTPLLVSLENAQLRITSFFHDNLLFEKIQ
jgi:hypothetical protein